MKHRHIALLAAIALLCGCSGGTEDPAVSESIPEPTAEISAPEQASAEVPTAPAGIADNTDPGSDSGVDLDAGGWTEYDDIFKLNGTWCSPEELPLTRTEYQLPEKWLKKDIQYSFWNGTMFLVARDKTYSEIFAPTPVEVRYIDLATGEERLVYSGLRGGVNESVKYPDEKYLPVLRTTGDESTLAVISAETGEELYSFPTGSGNIQLLPDDGIKTVYDTMYVGGKYTLPDFDESVDAIFTIDLLNGNIDLFGVNMSRPAYGSGNICWCEGESRTNLFGERAMDTILVDDTGISRYMAGTYYTTTKIVTNDNVLGSRYSLYWSGHDDPSDITQFLLGKAGYSVYPNTLHMTRNHIFSVWLSILNENTDKLLLGKYDDENGVHQAAMIDILDPKNMTLYSDNSAVYMVNSKSGRVTMYSAEE